MAVQAPFEPEPKKKVMPEWAEDEESAEEEQVPEAKVEPEETGLNYGSGNNYRGS